MADNNTFILFEEIKNKLETIYRELKELKEKENSPVSFTILAISACNISILKKCASIFDICFLMLSRTAALQNWKRRLPYP